MNDGGASLELHELSIATAGDGDPLVTDLSLSLRAGEIFALVGESGSGKSITSLAAMRLLPEALRVSGGQARLGGVDLLSLPEARMQSVRGRRMAMIFQNPMSGLNPVQTVFRQVAETLRLHTALRGRALRKRVTTLLAEVGIPDPQERLRFYPHQLSGGQQQRVMIAMALACEPEVLIADEPTTALDVTIQKQVLELLRSLARSRRLAVLLITHDMGVVRHSADRVAVLHQGRVLEEAPVDAFFAAPREPYSRRLIAALPDPDVFRPPLRAPALLEVRGLRVHFERRAGLLRRVRSVTRAVDDVSLTIARGETLALVGESGSGKSTLGRAVLGLEAVTDGAISFAGERLEHLWGRRRQPYRRRIQVIFQNPHSSMNPRLTVGDTIAEGMLSLDVLPDATARRRRVSELLARVRLPAGFAGRYPHELSGGQLQRIALARALAVAPELIICDEPTSALDVSIRADILRLLASIQEDDGVALLFITHDLSIVPGLAHRVAVMRDGRLVESGATEAVLTAPTHPYTRELLAAVPRLSR